MTGGGGTRPDHKQDAVKARKVRETGRLIDADVWPGTPGAPKKPAGRTVVQLPDPIRGIVHQAEDRLGDQLSWYKDLTDHNKKILNQIIDTAVHDFLTWEETYSAGKSHARMETLRPVVDGLFHIAPVGFTRIVSLRQALDVTRVIVNILEANVPAFARPGREEDAKEAMLYYAREVAFSAAAVYADLAEAREDWNARTETLAVEDLIDGITDHRVSARLSMLGWPVDYRCFALVGRLAQVDQLGSGLVQQHIRGTLESAGGQCLISNHDELTVVLINPGSNGRPEDICSDILRFFDRKRPVCCGPVRQNIQGASETTRAALSTSQVADAVDDGSAGHLIHADEVLPERALNGDRAAADQLYQEIYGNLRGEDPGNPLLTTLDTFLCSGGSLELTAKKLNVHPNTVRYRLKRSVEATGWDPTDPREAYVLHTALTIGRIRESNRDETAGPA